MIMMLMIVVTAGFTTLSNSLMKNDPVAINDAINKSLPLLEKSANVFLANAGCYSCHHQALSAISFSMAKEKGFAINDTILRETLQSIYDDIDSRFSPVEDNESFTVVRYDAWALASNHYPVDKTLALRSQYLAHRQTNDGNWVSPVLPRPPLECYSFSATALTVKTIQDYASPFMHNEVVQRVAKARSWLERQIAETNEEKIFQLLGLKWSNGDSAIIHEQVKKLMMTQHNDGGWSQLDSLQSDAYATGQSLYALNIAGKLNTDNPAFQKGIAFLLRTQFDDGSWKIESRTIPVLPFVEGGFPHGKNQFISAAGTNWATMALLLTAKENHD
jgi:N-acyl-D-amino-acid deacylase